MASDFRSLQYDAARATHSLTGIVDKLCEMQKQHPEIIAAERWDLELSYAELGRLLASIRKQAA